MSRVAGDERRIEISLDVPAHIPFAVVRTAQEAVHRFAAILVEAIQRPFLSPGSFQRWELDLHTLIPRECIDPVTGAMILAALKMDEIKAKAASILSSAPNLKLQHGRQRVSLNLLGGGKVTVQTPYYLNRPPSRRGPKRKPGQRGKAGNGMYPELAPLGIHERLTPAFASVVAREFVRGSLDEVQDALRRRGVERDRKAISRIVRVLGKRALRYQAVQMEAGDERQKAGWDLSGKRIGIFVDGGRIRTRVKKRGRKRKSGGKSYGTDWREPRVLVVCELDKAGRKKRLGYLRYDATIADADGTFSRLASLLREVDARNADLWVIGGDGAEWIWNRTARLAEELGYDEDKVVEVVDYWHATEYLTEFTTHLPAWTEAEKKSWVTRMIRFLRKGDIEGITEDMETCLKGPKSKRSNRSKMKTIIQRFQTNAHRMRYGELKKRRLPRGSGVVESAVRRIINLRAKGAGMFWREEMAEIVIHLRARYLSGHWEDYLAEVLQPEMAWVPNAAWDQELRAA